MRILALILILGMVFVFFVSTRPTPGDTKTLVVFRGGISQAERINQIIAAGHPIAALTSHSNIIVVGASIDQIRESDLWSQIVLTARATSFAGCGVPNQA